MGWCQGSETSNPTQTSSPGSRPAPRHLLDVPQVSLTVSSERIYHQLPSLPHLLNSPSSRWHHSLPVQDAELAGILGESEIVDTHPSTPYTHPETLQPQRRTSGYT